MSAKTAVLTAIWLTFTILLPEQKQGNAFTFKLALNLRPVRQVLLMRIGRC
jgi:hypothetical protein